MPESKKNTYIKYAQITCGCNSAFMHVVLGKKAHTYTSKKQQHNRKINQARELRH